MICFPNCKINLGINIIDKRNDGFHNIETILYPLPLHDILEVITAPDGNFRFFLTGFELDSIAEDNLVVKAYKLLKDEFQLEPVKVHLHKVIPSGAGLGGGSADAAFMISCLNDLFDLKLNKFQMHNFASQLGSDCSFFLENKPVFATQRGDKFSSVELDLSKYQIIVVRPNIHIPTKKAYSWIKPEHPGKSILEIIDKPVVQWKDSLVNDFEKPVFKRFPLLKDIKADLYRSGAAYASMTGSGAAIFGIFENEINLKDQFRDFFYWRGKRGNGLLGEWGK
ncbi:MAG: 4-(cytidine 5'-diphospho)-2-C-methyl-D-erythritol kinase [Bacteroidales bacterium]|nr:4-(cytidine 5'-diphospho)-2-C-methyl-D-erythritol kinase [Bacteroidales bacterium]